MGNGADEAGRVGSRVKEGTIEAARGIIEGGLWWEGVIGADWAGLTVGESPCYNRCDMCRDCALN